MVDTFTWAPVVHKAGQIQAPCGVYLSDVFDGIQRSESHYWCNVTCPVCILRGAVSPDKWEHCQDTLDMGVGGGNADRDDN